LRPPLTKRRSIVASPADARLTLYRLTGSRSRPAFIWYSGNTVINRAGSLMLYLSGAEAYAWYASFWKEEQWKFHDENRIARRELVSFEESGRQLEILEYSAHNH
jgi:hypothetical protein